MPNDPLVPLPHAGTRPAQAPFAGVRIPPCWAIVPPDQPVPGDGIPVVLRPGAGFGTGTHPSTRLCLQALAAFAPRDGRPWRMLDFGSGSGILAVAAAKLGATVAAIEIEEEALANAEENASLNGVSDRIRLSRTLDGVSGPFDVVIANILRPVLLDFAEALTARLSPDGSLVLAGLVATDVPELSVRYAARLEGRRPEVYQVGEWRALAWRPGHPVGSGSAARA